MDKFTMRCERASGDPLDAVALPELVGMFAVGFKHLISALIRGQKIDPAALLPRGWWRNVIEYEGWTFNWTGTQPSITKSEARPRHLK